MTAHRHLLHKNKVEDFKRYLDEIGVTHRPGRGDYEILQVYRNDGQWFKLYSRHNMPEHVTVQGPLCPLVRSYLHARHLEDEPDVSTVAAINGELTLEPRPKLQADGEPGPPWD